MIDEDEERARRELLILAAYAYAELPLADPLMTDFEFDEECNKVDLSIVLSSGYIDTWFRKEFEPCTGMWISSLRDDASEVIFRIGIVRGYWTQKDREEGIT